MENTAFAPLKITTKKKKISYAKWGYIFLAPFFLAFLIFQLIPLGETFYYAFFEYYMDGLDVIGPNPVGFQNFKEIFDYGFWDYAANTLVIWIVGFTPQIIISLALAIWFTDMRLNLKFTQFFKTVIYMPNLVMASAFGMLFATLTSQTGPIVNILISMGWLSQADASVFTDTIWGSRSVIAFMNFLMWFGNTTLLLMSGVMGIDSSIYEAATIDGSNAWKTFWHITMPLLMPIFIYVFITSMIGGIQLFDAAEIFTQGGGGPGVSSKTLMMFLYSYIMTSKDYGHAGAISILLFLVTAILSFLVFYVTMPRDQVKVKSHRRLVQERTSLKVSPSAATVPSVSSSPEQGEKIGKED
jgi:cellobiose transport system permease protein